MREVLLEINAKLKLLPDRIVKDNESFVAGYVACILLFLRECPQFDTDFAPVLHEYNLRTDDADSREVSKAWKCGLYFVLDNLSVICCEFAVASGSINE